ncbi:MAG: DUF2219 family protein [Halomonadaceae bacterium]|nr:MAG: DUF2219 family protein [Halomonadaceae bacterium]
MRGNIEGKRVEKNILREGNTRRVNEVPEHSYGVVLERDVLSASIGAVLHYSGLELGFDTLYESKAYNTQYYDLDGAVKFFGRDQVPGGHYMVRLTLKKVY